MSNSTPVYQLDATHANSFRSGVSFRGVKASLADILDDLPHYDIGTAPNIRPAVARAHGSTWHRRGRTCVV